jgi:solute carrier family 13 (sodium-dependent dicarboxylate transporter), member 2/3/5
MKAEEQHLQIEGGIERLRKEYVLLGKMAFDEYKSIAIFIVVLILWALGLKQRIYLQVWWMLCSITMVLPKKRRFGYSIWG